MNLTFAIGLLGSLVLVTGAAWPASKKKTHPARSIKNWLFALGGYVMLTYALISYFQGASSPLFIFLQAFVGTSTIMMLFNVRRKISLPILIATGFGFVIWSLLITQDYSTIFFITGLTGIAVGYALIEESVYRQSALLLGSLLIAIFSYLGSNWVFFWLNFFYSFFAGYYATKLLLQKR
jgi:hypothetical protein